VRSLRNAIVIGYRREEETWRQTVRSILERNPAHPPMNEECPPLTSEEIEELENSLEKAIAAFAILYDVEPARARDAARDALLSWPWPWHTGGPAQDWLRVLDIAVRYPRRFMRLVPPPRIAAND
jgi:hypothetical protein